MQPFLALPIFGVNKKTKLAENTLMTTANMQRQIKAMSTLA